MSFQKQNGLVLCFALFVVYFVFLKFYIIEYLIVSILNHLLKGCQEVLCPEVVVFSETFCHLVQNSIAESYSQVSRM